MPTPEYKPGSRVIYARGIKTLLLGKAGVIEEIDDRDGPHIIMAQVQFDGLGSYPCWVGNLDPEEPSPV